MPRFVESIQLFIYCHSVLCDTQGRNVILFFVWLATMLFVLLHHALGQGRLWSTKSPRQPLDAIYMSATLLIIFPVKVIHKQMLLVYLLFFQHTFFLTHQQDSIYSDLTCLEHREGSQPNNPQHHGSPIRFKSRR